MVSHNNAVPQSKWKKQWTRRTKLFFDGPAKAKKRQQLRIKKAKNVFPRPTELLRPVVRLSGRRYNRRVATGRGFSLEELKAVGIPVNFARTVGISVDIRRRDLSEERLQANVQRLQEYKNRVVLFPRNKGVVKKGPIADSQVKVETQVKGAVLPVKKETFVVETREITKQEKETSAVKAIVKARKSIKQFSYLQKKKNKASSNIAPAGAVVAEE